jgi:hypothetical protein
MEFKLNARNKNCKQDNFWPLKASFADVEIFMQVHQRYERKHLQLA